MGDVGVEGSLGSRSKSLAAVGVGGSRWRRWDSVRVGGSRGSRFGRFHSSWKAASDVRRQEGCHDSINGINALKIMVYNTNHT